MNQKGFSPILIILGIILVIGIAGGTYYFGKTQVPKPQPQNPIVTSQTPQPTSTSTSQTIPIPSPISTDETANWKIYSDQKQKYTIQYPDNWSVFPNIIGGVVDGYKGTVINSSKALEPHGEILAEQGQAGIAINVVATDKLPTETLSEYTKRNNEVFGNMKNLTVSSLGSNPALKYIRAGDDPDPGQPIYIVSTENLVLEINVSVQNDKYKNTVDQILSTFRFD